MISSIAESPSAHGDHGLRVGIRAAGEEGKASRQRERLGGIPCTALPAPWGAGSWRWLLLCLPSTSGV